ncbi:MAG: hypothetical protein JW753_01985 [Dehalococcoidia bacterium]|nr:hypothetical protein [Dehalococcoidia bacterium]
MAKHEEKRTLGSRRCVALLLVVLLVISTTLLVAPTRAVAEPATITLNGWGWCVAYREIGNVSLVLDGSTIPRESTDNVQDLYLTGTLTFNLDDRTDEFELELRGTRIRSLFFLKQVSGGDIPLIAEFEGTWLSETDYVACEGRIAVTAPNHVAKPYFFVLRTEDAEMPSRLTGDWVANVDFMVGKLTSAFDSIADRLATGGLVIKDNLGDLLTNIAVIVREVRNLGIPYFA